MSTDGHIESKCGIENLDISSVQIRVVNDGRDGLLAWASCVLNNAIHLNNVAIRRGRDGNLMLTYPAKMTEAGSRFYYFNPVSREASEAMEDAVWNALQLFNECQPRDATKEAEAFDDSL